MRFTVPFIHDEAYRNQLKRLSGRLYALYYSLYDPMLSDARIHLRSIDVKCLISALEQLPAPKKYLLANGRFQPVENYQTHDAMALLVKKLTALYDARVLDGIIFSDPYFLRALSQTAPNLTARLEAMPSINFMIDGVEKLEAVFSIIMQSGFRLPEKITLDRALNRRPQALATLSRWIRKRDPNLLIELLANEGCLNHCPFRATHEALISAANSSGGVDTFRLNRDLGCMALLNKAPHHILASPFIRPQDLERYRNTADIIKICGRTLGPKFLTRAVKAYDAGTYDGNLLDLLDAANWMAQRWVLSNSKLPEDLVDQLEKCRQNCSDCSVCKDIFKRCATPLPFGLKPFNANGTNRA